MLCLFVDLQLVKVLDDYVRALNNVFRSALKLNLKHLFETVFSLWKYHQSNTCI